MCFKWMVVIGLVLVLSSVAGLVLVMLYGPPE